MLDSELDVINSATKTVSKTDDAILPVNDADLLIDMSNNVNQNRLMAGKLNKTELARLRKYYPDLDDLALQQKAKEIGQEISRQKIVNNGLLDSELDVINSVNKNTTKADGAADVNKVTTSVTPTAVPKTKDIQEIERTLGSSLTRAKRSVKNNPGRTAVFEKNTLNDDEWKILNESLAKDNMEVVPTGNNSMILREKLTTTDKLSDIRSRAYNEFDTHMNNISKGTEKELHVPKSRLSDDEWKLLESDLNKEGLEITEANQSYYTIRKAKNIDNVSSASKSSSKADDITKLRRSASKNFDTYLNEAKTNGKSDNLIPKSRLKDSEWKTLNQSLAAENVHLEETTVNKRAYMRFVRNDYTGDVVDITKLRRSASKNFDTYLNEAKTNGKSDNLIPKSRLKDSEWETLNQSLAAENMHLEETTQNGKAYMQFVRNDYIDDAADVGKGISSVTTGISSEKQVGRWKFTASSDNRFGVKYYEQVFDDPDAALNAARNISDDLGQKAVVFERDNEYVVAIFDNTSDFNKAQKKLGKKELLTASTSRKTSSASKTTNGKTKIKDAPEVITVDDVNEIVLRNEKIAQENYTYVQKVKNSGPEGERWVALWEEYAPKNQSLEQFQKSFGNDLNKAEESLVKGKLDFMEKSESELREEFGKMWDEFADEYGMVYKEYYQIREADITAGGSARLTPKTKGLEKWSQEQIDKAEEIYKKGQEITTKNEGRYATLNTDVTQIKKEYEASIKQLDEDYAVIQKNYKNQYGTTDGLKETNEYKTWKTEYDKVAEQYQYKIGQIALENKTVVSKEMADNLDNLIVGDAKLGKRLNSWNNLSKDEKIDLLQDIINGYADKYGTPHIKVLGEDRPRTTVRGEYDPSTKAITINTNKEVNLIYTTPDDALSTLMHEYGHAIDDISPNKGSVGAQIMRQGVDPYTSTGETYPLAPTEQSSYSHSGAIKEGRNWPLERAKQNEKAINAVTETNSASTKVDNTVTVSKTQSSGVTATNINALKNKASSNFDRDLKYLENGDINRFYLKKAKLSDAEWKVLREDLNVKGFDIVNAEDDFASFWVVRKANKADNVVTISAAQAQASNVARLRQTASKNFDKYLADVKTSLTGEGAKLPKSRLNDAGWNEINKSLAPENVQLVDTGDGHMQFIRANYVKTEVNSAAKSAGNIDNSIHDFLSRSSTLQSLNAQGRLNMVTSSSLNGKQYMKISMGQKPNMKEAQQIIHQLQNEGFYVSSNIAKGDEKFIGVSRENIFGPWSKSSNNWAFSRSASANLYEDWKVFGKGKKESYELDFAVLDNNETELSEFNDLVVKEGYVAQKEGNKIVVQTKMKALIGEHASSENWYSQHQRLYQKIRRGSARAVNENNVDAAISNLKNPSHSNLAYRGPTARYQWEQRVVGSGSGTTNYHMSLNVDVNGDLVRKLDDVISADGGKNVLYYKMPPKGRSDLWSTMSDPITIYLKSTDPSLEQKIAEAVRPFVRGNDGLIGRQIENGIAIAPETSGSAKYLFDNIVNSIASKDPVLAKEISTAYPSGASVGNTEALRIWASDFLGYELKPLCFNKN